MTSEPATVVLVHGAWHGAWCWEKVVALLDKAGISATAAELPLTSFVDDVQATTSALQEIDGRAVLCGHSYGGAVITEAGREPNVEHLVYLTAFACDTGESPSATAVEENLPYADFNDGLVFSEDGATMSVSPESAPEIFYHDCDRADVDAAVARLRPINLLCATTPTTAPAWRLKPSTYVICSEDRALHPAMQRHLAKRCTNSVEWPTAHSPFLNRADLVASLLAELGAMKVRIGYGLGTRSLTNDAGRFNAFVDALEGNGFDSLWLSERITGDCPDPLIGLAVAAGRTKKLKLGTSVQVLPGRNPVLLAKEWASLDRLSGGRTLPAFGLGVADPREQQAFGVARGDRAKWFDEALPLIRRLWSEDSVDHHGERFHFDAVSVRPKPVQQPPDVWLGGLAPSELRRIGRLADGWLPSFCTPADVERSRPVVEEAAAAANRSFDDEHWGALVAYCDGPVPDLVSAALAARRPDLEDPTEVIAAGIDGLRLQIERFVGAGVSKFVVVPLAEPEDWDAELARVADALLPLQRTASPAA